MASTKHTKPAKPKRARKSRAKTDGARPGGQPGNKNALKHGFWATRTSLDKKFVLELRDEILWLGGVVERLAIKLDAVLESDGLLNEDERANLRMAFDAIDRRANAMQAHAFLVGDSGQLEKEIEEGLFLARSDLGILDYLALPETVAGAADSGSDAQP